MNNLLLVRYRGYTVKKNHSTNAAIQTYTLARFNIAVTTGGYSQVYMYLSTNSISLILHNTYRARLLDSPPSA